MAVMSRVELSIAVGRDAVALYCKLQCDASLWPNLAGSKHGIGMSSPATTMQPPRNKSPTKAPGLW